MISQKDIVVKLVKETLGSNYDINVPCLSKLTGTELRRITSEITDMMIRKEVTYSKINDVSGMPSRDFIMKYVKSMVKNHLTKARELNGNNSSATSNSVVKVTTNIVNKQKTNVTPTPEYISQEFKDFVRLTYKVAI